MDETISLKVKGMEVSLNPFVKKVFIKVIQGLVGSLDKLPEEGLPIEVKIDKK